MMQRNISTTEAYSGRPVGVTEYLFDDTTTDFQGRQVVIKLTPVSGMQSRYAKLAHYSLSYTHSYMMVMLIIPLHSGKITNYKRSLKRVRGTDP